MKKTLTFVLLSLFGAATMTAEQLTPAQALARVKGNSQARKVIGSRNLSAQLIAELPELYVFSSGAGFMILPADDIAMPLLGYSDSGEFNPEQNPALKWWLSTYSTEIAYAAANGISTLAESPERKAIEPLLKTTWDQSAPYNDMAPEVNGNRSVTGCVATAMAQVMKYHNWPEKGQGEISYNWNNTTLSMDFSDVSFDWVNMTDSYGDTSTDEQKTAVATLMKACGYSVKMNYSPKASGAASLLIGPALVDYFNYDKGIWQPDRDWYTASEWEDLIYGDLAAGRPVLYAGQSATGGHQFVCDGYSSDGFFHFNWGWGGVSDGYFKLNALNPGSQGIGGHAGGYNMGQSVVLGVQRPVANAKPVYTLALLGDFKPEREDYTLGTSTVTFNTWIRNTGSVSLPAGSIVAMEMTTEDGSQTFYYYCFTMGELKPLYGYENFSATLNQQINDGTYTARLVFRTPDTDWQPVHVPMTNVRELTVKVEEPNISFIAESEPGFTVTDLPESKTIFIDTKFVISMTLTNKTATEYTGSMYPKIMKSDSDDEVASGTSVPIDLAGNETTSFDYVGQLYAPSGSTLTAGDYRLVFVNKQTGEILCEPIEITLADTPTNTEIKFSDFSFDGMQPGDKAKFSLTVTCTEGYFSGSFAIVVYPEEGGSAVAYNYFSVLLGEGESVKNTYEVDLSDVDFGQYKAYPYYNTSIPPAVKFSFTEHTTEIDEISSDSTDTAIYDLQGRKVSNPAPGHIYIRAGKLIRL